ncbi:PPE domain-containing protein [Nocardia gamkensis]|jgi:PPE-repeat protein|uniref:PPE family protein n=1 Tax=Nocardia gamkensis TaxID=352869 RepID=A0A7X6L5R5_9NOCA|nr:PPE domain-containing protein [Nocardia gamkensis]NKY28217.1 PPE family protein [Nocardia gamkensis]NQE70762.1 putative PPE family protein PPE29 [Nocardia gamkensis]
MVAGVTGVIWAARPSEINSATLHAGAHAIPISAAATAWGGLTAAWIDATTTVARVMAELGVGMQGINGIAALSKLTGFLGWSEQQGVQAAAMGAKAAANATAYTVASLAMPSPPEIAAVNAALAASANPPGVLSGAFEVAEVARNAMDIRAALVMETYEAATSAMVATPAEFLLPPPIAKGAGSAGPEQAADTTTEVPADPIQAAVAATQAFLSNPGVASAATQAAQAVGSIATTGVSTVGNVAGSAIAAATTTSAPTFSGMAPMAMGAGAAATATGAATRAVSFSGLGSAGISNGSLKLPEGWGSSGTIGGSAPVQETVAVKPVEAAPVRPANNGNGNPLLGNQARSDEEDESEHNGRDYLRSTEHFNDGRFTADGVIGGDFSGTVR